MARGWVYGYQRHKHDDRSGNSETIKPYTIARLYSAFHTDDESKPDDPEHAASEQPIHAESE
jgi:hypothetical protein